ncbi:phosphohistidine phosphatase domain protein [Mycobacterium intracellulare MIN_061107_1834]|nr:phosphohistidine phosphatase domain protein [Mycobacterium intracellulare MIN_061107_1834]
MSRTLPFDAKTPVSTPASRNRRVSAWVRSNAVSNSTASWRRGSMVTGIDQPSHGVQRR